VSHLESLHNLVNQQFTDDQCKKCSAPRYKWILMSKYAKTFIDVALDLIY
jgi:hypothetical protein